MSGPAPVVEVVGLGPAGPELISVDTQRLIDSVPERFVRTRRHPAAAAVPGARSCDDIYDSAALMESVYVAIVDRLVAAARRHGRVLYAVPGSPSVAERSVRLLAGDGRVEARLHPALSFADLAWVRLAIDPLTEGVRLVDGQRFAALAAGHSGPFLLAQCDSAFWLAEIAEALAPPSPDVWVLHHLGLPDERVRRVKARDLARWEADHLTSVFVPRLAEPVAAALVRFDDLVTTLRERCPWDREQTHRSLRRHLIEETYEVLEAIDGLPPMAGGRGEVPGSGQGAGGAPTGVPLEQAPGDSYEALEEELGDLLFHVFFHARMAAEAGQFTVADVVRTVDAKLRARHPHVFGDVVANSSEDVRANWERIKKEEKGRASAMDGIPEALPALLLALKVQKRAEAFSEGDPDEGANAAEQSAARLQAALADAPSRRDEDWLGDLLFETVNLARLSSLDPESALRGAAKRVKEDFAAAELEPRTPAG